VHDLLRCPREGCDPKALRAASPASFVDARDPPALLVAGEADVQLRPEQSRRLAAQLRAAGVPVELLLIPDVGHGLVGRTEAATRTATQQALVATYAFFTRTLVEIPGPAGR
jgi:dipeptidyl aminopeptidase/acylaminoacyl peptidase